MLEDINKKALTLSILILVGIVGLFHLILTNSAAAIMASFILMFIIVSAGLISFVYILYEVIDEFIG